MKKHLLLLIISCLAFQVEAQNIRFHYSNALKFVDTNNDTFAYPFIGGMDAPQFNEVDLNQDSIKDLMVFDRSGNKILTFLNEGITGQPSYFYAPQYAAQFPQLSSWVLMRDYNCDGKNDIFTYYSGSSGVTLYKNTSHNGQLEFTHVTDELATKDGQRLYNLSLDIPVIDDLDGDGDLDFLSFGSLGGYIEMYRNERVEDGDPCDSMRFKYVDYCWGSFAEAGTTNEVFLGDNCFGFKFYKNSLHSGSTILTLDADEDGDKEVIIGDVDFPEFKYLTNGKVENGWPYDTMVSAVTGYPQNKPVYIYKFPAAFYLDLNNDGVKDLIAASNEAITAKNVEQNWFYSNSGKTNKPVFNFVDSNFLMNESFDFGSRTSMSFLDYDGDGDLDLIVANRGNYIETNNDADRIAVFERIGQGTNTHFKLVQTDYQGFANQGFQGLHPAFGDLNGDGKPDMIMGFLNGKLSYYTNTGSGSTPDFTLTEDTLADIDVGTSSTPFIYDLDGDNVNDLVVGSEAGILRFFKNYGTASSPAFADTAEIDSLGKILVKSFFYSPVYDSAFNIVDSVRKFNSIGNSAPWIADLDQDGNPEVITGAYNGKVYIHVMDTNNLADSFQEVTDYFLHPKTGKYDRYNTGGLGKPACDDVNGDGLPDILLGNSRGGIEYISTVAAPYDSLVNKVREIPIADSRIYPNPAREEVYVELSDRLPVDVQVQLIDILGRPIKGYNIPANFNGKLRIDTQNLKSGIYFIRLDGTGYRFDTHRLVVVR